MYVPTVAIFLAGVIPITLWYVVPDEDRFEAMTYVYLWLWSVIVVLIATMFPAVRTDYGLNLVVIVVVFGSAGIFFWKRYKALQRNH